MKETRTTNILLLIIVIPLVFYLLKTLSFIFIPLVSAMFIAILFLPIMRWLNKKKVPKPIAIFIIVLIFIGIFKIGNELIQLSSTEILSGNSLFFEKAEIKLVNLIVYVENVFGITRAPGENVIAHYFQNNSILANFGITLEFISNTITKSFMTIFFAVLLLSGSINFENLLNHTIIERKHTSVKTFRKIEKDVMKFVVVKFIISLFTGIGFGLACLFFDVSFPIFWGLFAFFINFVQMIGSIISVVLLAIFALVEIEPTSTLLFFILSITAVQVLMGSILEPIFMGKTFSVNVITILIMLMFWGYIWGIPGLILSIPITVFIKIILDQFPKYKVISSLIKGS